MTVILNAANRPLNANTGTVPNVGAALLQWFQPMTFGLIVKTVSGFQVVETETQVSFRGVWQPLTGRQLMLKPEGERAWNWFWLHSDPTLNLKVDDVIIYLGIQYRVMSQKDYDLYGYREWTIVEDWSGSDPKVVP